MLAAPQQSTAPTVPRVINTIVKVILRSPLHGFMSQKRTLLTFRGRKSGKVYTIPVSYLREGETIVCFTDSPWWNGKISALVLPFVSVWSDVTLQE